MLIVGDFTARVGDPSGRSAERPVLSAEQIDANAASFQEQAFKVLDPERTEVRRNGEWLDMGTEELFRLLRRFTIARLLERDDFARRMEAARPISVLELLYPVLQGYDSVAVQADVELGGTDQKFNLLFARDVQEAFGEPAQSIVTMPILPGTDGVRRMSKSLGNYVGIAEPAGGDVRKADEHPGRRDGRLRRLLLGEEAVATTSIRWRRSASSRGAWWSASTGRTRRRGGAAVRPHPRRARARPRTSRRWR